MNKIKLSDFDPQVKQAIAGELKRQEEGLEMIPSENFVSLAVLEALGSVLTNKYAEGFVGRRYYGGNQFTDIVEGLAIERAKKIFRCDHANVQPLSGSPMNQAVYLAFCKPGDTIMGMDLSHGGHLTHGAPVSHMGKLFNFVRYKTHPENGGKIDFDELLKTAKEAKPKILLCGYTSYPRDYDYTDFKRVADEVGAITMADVAHIGGLIAGGAMRNPFDYGFDIVTTTTHKTLRGPRSAMIFSRRIPVIHNTLLRQEASGGQAKYMLHELIDKAVFPGLQGGPHLNQIAGVAVALGEALNPKFKIYAHQIVKNAKALAEELKKRGWRIVSGGTDSHLILVDTWMDGKGISGRDAADKLEKAGIIVNQNTIPFDTRKPMDPSGIRLGTPAVTTRGMKEVDMVNLAEKIDEILRM